MSTRQLSRGRTSAYGAERSPYPKYLEVENFLRHRIEEDLVPGDTIPSEASLMQNFRVSRVTVRRALKRLEQEGLIRRQQGKGTFVEARPATYARSELDSLKSGRKGANDGIEVKILEKIPVKASAEVANNLELSENDIVIRIKRLYYVDNFPVMYSTAHLPNRVGLLVLDEDLERNPIINILMRKHKIALVEASQSISPVLADEELSTLLECRVGTPILRVDHVFFTTGRQPFNFARDFYRSDRYRIRVIQSSRPARSSRLIRLRIGVQAVSWEFEV